MPPCEMFLQGSSMFQFNCKWTIFSSSFFVVACVIFSKFTDASVLWNITHYQNNKPLRDFNSTVAWSRGNAVVTPDPDEGSQDMCLNTLRVFYPKGSTSPDVSKKKGGIGFFSYPFPKTTKLSLTYEVYFPKDFDFVLGGKLPGLFGGGIGCTGGAFSDGCFSLRYMWREGGTGEVYAYIPPYGQDPSFCKMSDNYCSRYAQTIGRGRFRFRRGQWHTLSQEVHLNTLGRREGVLRVYMDGVLLINLDNLNYTADPTLTIDGIMFTTFFGGSTKAWASTKDTYIYFRRWYITSGSTEFPLPEAKCVVTTPKLPKAEETKVRGTASRQNGALFVAMATVVCYCKLCNFL